ncbi:MAG: hypothetical protein HOJ15_00190 [Candidatus Jacksonbacteria bacterium]|jgi:hypothetical protein|nr:hypothetical protein [Candidatus Jacksonbacteria bacterium]
MKEFALLFKGGQTPGEPGSDEFNAYMMEWKTWMEALKEDGSFVSGEPLEDTGKIVSGAEGNVADMSLDNEDQIVGGYIFVKAGSIDQATEIAKGSPLLKVGGNVEVRGIMEMKM